MLTFPNKGRLVQAVSELPNLSNAKYLYLDLETTSGDPKKKSLNPWHDCSIAGIGVTADDIDGAWYVPIGHNDGHWNLPRDPVLDWLRQLLRTCEHWVNHNVKYDAHVAARVGATTNATMIDTVVMAKIVDSDRQFKGGYALDVLGRQWLGQPAYKDRVKQFVKACNSQDYGDVPADILGEYCCQDVLTNRELYRWLLERVPEQCVPIWRNTEIPLTAALFDIEERGFCINPQELELTQLRILNTVLKTEEELQEITGMAVRAHVSADCHAVLCTHYGLPVLRYTDDDKKSKHHNPSFDKYALISYAQHPVTLRNPEIARVVKLLQLCRTQGILGSFFVEPFRKLHVDGVVHTNFNQIIRTGRMSSTNPNSQNLSPAAKALVHPRPGYTFISFDQSQVEFRLIVHYIRNERCIADYNNDPTTDFHEWVAGMCEIPRKPAKTINFAIAFSGGEELVCKQLMGQTAFMEALVAVAEKHAGPGADEATITRIFSQLCRQRARQVYSQYHATLPELKPTARIAERICKQRGYVRTFYNRRRHMGPRDAYRGFSSVIQGTAADIIKRALVATAARYNAWFRDNDVHQISCVHDELTFEAPIEVAKDPATYTRIAELMERDGQDFRVPLRVEAGESAKSWKAAGSDACRMEIVRGEH